MSKEVTIADQILALLSEGDMWADEIVACVSAQPVSIRMCLCQLVKQGAIVRVKRGIYRKKEVLEEAGTAENLRKNSDNVETINLLLNMCDKVLDDFTRKIETEDWMAAGKQMDVIKSLQWLVGVIDPLMHRWYIVHRGYDANPYLAEADVERRDSAANPVGEPSEASHEIISWESEKETLAEAIERHEKKKEGS